MVKKKTDEEEEEFEEEDEEEEFEEEERPKQVKKKIENKPREKRYIPYRQPETTGILDKNSEKVYPIDAAIAEIWNTLEELKEGLL